MKSSTQIDSQIHSRHDLDERESSPTNVLTPTMTIAFLPWGDLFEDVNDPLGLSFEAFATELNSGWIFNYIYALKLAGVRTVMFQFSARVTEPLRFTHPLTGATMCMLPVPRLYRAYRGVIGEKLNRFAVKQEANNGGGNSGDNSNVDDRDTLTRNRSPLSLLLRNGARSLGSYLCTPLGLLAREMRREGCSAILCQEYEFPRFDVCVLLGQLMRLPVFAMFQGGNQMDSFIEYPLRQLALRTCAGLIVAPQTEIQRVQSRYGLPSAKVANIFNPLDVLSWRASDRSEARDMIGIPLAARVVAWHGRMQMGHKGLDILLDAWNQICCERPGKELRLLLVGTGSDANELRSRIAVMQLQGIVWLDEFVRDRTIIQRYLSAADVYVLPSRNEGFPLAPVEAMACGLPLVATDVPGIPDILVGGEASGGIVVPRGDATALALALGRVLDDEDWGRLLGKRARRRVEECFTLEAIGKQVRDFLSTSDAARSAESRSR